MARFFYLLPLSFGPCGRFATTAVVCNLSAGGAGDIVEYRRLKAAPKPGHRFKERRRGWRVGFDYCDEIAVVKTKGFQFFCRFMGEGGSVLVNQHLCRLMSLGRK